MERIDEAQQRQLEEMAGHVLPEDERRVLEQLTEARLKAGVRGADPELVESVRMLAALLRDEGFHTDPQTRAWAVVALDYFISPADLVPDVVIGQGYDDDVVVVGWIVHRIRDEVARWRRERPAGQG